MENETKTELKRSADIKNIAKALSNFQGSLETVKRESENPFFKSKYAELGSLIEAIKTPMKENGLSYVQFPQTINGEVWLTTLLMHETGEWLEGSYSLKPKENTPQGVGSAITYMRRYALGAVLGIATEEDDDGNAATGAPVQPKPVVIATGQVCDICGAGALISAKSGKPYCPNWKKHKEDGEYSTIVNAENKAKMDEFFSDMGEVQTEPKKIKKTKIIE